MTQPEVDDLSAIIPPLLRSLEALEFISRYMNPRDFDAVLDACGTPDEGLRQSLTLLTTWSPELTGLRA
eukprot:gene42079-66282_t